MKKIIFLGTSEFAVPILERLIKVCKLKCRDEALPRLCKNYQLVAVVTQPDRSVGRGRKLQSSPVKLIAQRYNISFLQPEKITEITQELENLSPDLMIVAGYGQILPRSVLNIPQKGVLNIHPSLLPKYRGPSPIQATILNGEKETGITIILMDEKMDHGPILKNKKLKIKNKKLTYESLLKILANLGAELVAQILPGYLRGQIRPQPQDHSQATYTRLLKKEDGEIDWYKFSQEIERQVRAFCPWPGTYTKVKSEKLKVKSDYKILKILKASVIQEKQRPPGKVFLTKTKKLAVACGQGSLILEKLQLEGRKKLRAQEFLRGHREMVGAILK